MNWPLAWDLDEVFVIPMNTVQRAAGILPAEVLVLDPSSVADLLRRVDNVSNTVAGYFLALLLCRPLKVSSAIPDLSNSPQAFFHHAVVLFLRRGGQWRFRPFSLARLRAMPESLARARRRRSRNVRGSACLRRRFATPGGGAGL